MIGAGLGLLGFSPAVLYGFTYVEFLQAYGAYLKREEEKQRAEWERTRWATCMLLQPHTGKKKLKPQDLITFPWESKRQANRSEKQAIALLKKGAKSIEYGQG